MSAYRTLATAIAAVLLVASASGSRADVQPGDVITTANADKVKDLVSPAMYWCVEHGFPLTIVETRSIPLRRAFVEATEKYSAQVKLSDDGLRMEGFVAGRPFPRIDVNDPKAAIKIMQNYSFAIAFDDLDLRNFDGDTGPISRERPLQIERHFLIEHFRRLFYVGRLYVDPKPEIPNGEGYHYKETLHPLVEPFDLKGVGFTYYRYLEPAKQDDSWLYLPSLRRVRRLSTAQRSDALFGQDTDQDSYAGYSGSIAWMDWKLLGEKEVLGAFHTQHYPARWTEGAADWSFDDVWEKRQVYVVEGVSKLPQYAFSKRVLYVDKEIYQVPYSDMYDRGGELWKIWVNDFGFRKEAFPGSPVKYDEDTPFPAAAVMIDIQLEHATRVSLPSSRFPGEPGWYWHQGEKSGTTEDQFTIAELIGSGH
ncbi:MAG: DUF1329 domain-containing protein [Deltaproteobacteria bacterium]|nr:DUF1329 domain-containing protein [Deltaproteobacteria bacterium]